MTQSYILKKKNYANHFLDVIAVVSVITIFLNDKNSRETTINDLVVILLKHFNHYVHKFITLNY